MSGRRITRVQVRGYMDDRREGRTQEAAAAREGFSRRSATRIEEEGAQRLMPRPMRSYRTRPDPFEAVWLSELVPWLAKKPPIRAVTLLAWLQERYPARYGDALLRTLQRRVREWRALSGPERLICFPQTHPPGAMLIADFTVMDGLDITIGGVPLPHRLLHARLPCSGWAFATVVLGGESFPALAEGLRQAFAALGGLPRELRTDSLSAAYRNLDAQAQADVTAAYDGFCAHYGLTATRCNPGESHENGAIESPHGHLKDRIAQRLIVRSSRDFSDLDAYRRWLASLMAENNTGKEAALAAERPHLRPLPMAAPVTWSVVTARVTTFGTILVRKGVYSVPSRLVGRQLTVHLFDDRLECFLGSIPVITLARVHRRPHQPDARAYRIDFRHVADSLRRKPGAILHLAYRDYLHPSPVYRSAWEALEAASDARRACRVYAGLLHLAHTGDCLEALETALREDLARGALPDLEALTRRFAPGEGTPAHPMIEVVQHDLSTYDALLSHPDSLEIPA